MMIINQMIFTQNELNEEVWRPLSDIPEKYKEYLNLKDKMLFLFKKYYISNLGRVAKLNSKNQLILKCIKLDSKGYAHVILYHNNKAYNYQVHRLVGFLFIENNDIKNKTVINHLHEFKTYDNRAINLEWATPQRNINYGTRNYRAGQNISSNKLNNNTLSKKVIAFNVIENNEIIYDSITSASEQTKISKVKIYNMCTIQKDLIFKNFKFRFVNEDQFIKRPKIINEPIIQLNYDYELQKVFICTDDIKDAYKSANIHLILKSCKSNGTIMHYNSRWMFLKEYNKAFNANIVPEIKIVLLTERLKFKKLYTNAFDLINDGFNINSAIKHCKHKSVSNKDRCWMFLDDFLKFKDINSLNKLSAQDISKK